MKLSREGIAFIAARERFRAKAYLCPAGVLTIGYGFTNRSGSFSRYWRGKHGRNLIKGDIISKDEALKLLGMVADEE